MIFTISVAHCSSWCSKLPPGIISFLCSSPFRAGLLPTNSLNSSLSENVFTSPSSWRLFFAGCAVLFWPSFYFSTLKISCQFLLASITPSKVLSFELFSVNWHVLSLWGCPSKVLSFELFSVNWHVLSLWRCPNRVLAFELFLVRWHVLSLWRCPSKRSGIWAVPS